MRIYNPSDVDLQLKPGLANALATIRLWRGFDPKTYVLAKSQLLNEYMRQNGLSASQSWLQQFFP